MKTLFYLFIFFGFLFYTAKPSLSFHPFSLSFETPYLSFSLFFLMMAVLFHGMHYEADPKLDLELKDLAYKQAYMTGKLDQMKESNLRLQELQNRVQEFVEKTDDQPYSK
jgi:hypothetical protein